MRYVLAAALAIVAAPALAEDVFKFDVPEVWANEPTKIGLWPCKTGWHLPGSPVETGYIPYEIMVRTTADYPPGYAPPIVVVGNTPVVLYPGQEIRLYCFDSGDLP